VALEARLVSAQTMLDELERSMTDNEGAPTAECTIGANTLGRALGQVLFAASKDPGRPELAGVVVECKDGSLRGRTREPAGRRRSVRIAPGRRGRPGGGARGRGACFACLAGGVPRLRERPSRAPFRASLPSRSFGLGRRRQPRGGLPGHSSLRPP
jgi:hypothetical protein